MGRRHRQQEATTIDGKVRDRETRGPAAADPAPVPGLVIIFSGSRPTLQAIPLGKDELLIGRDGLRELAPDMLMSRRHARISWDGERLCVADLGSRNGTWVDGLRVPSMGSRELSHCLRTGDSLFIGVPDLRPFQKTGIRCQGDFVIGPRLQIAYTEIAGMARVSSTLHISGASGTGKEQAARLFHSSSRCAAGPFVAVNCAVIPPGVAERLLFGCKKGAYSGAQTDEPGYIQAAHGGTLFLDEIADLDPLVQAKLLRVLESREVLVLGAVRSRPVDIRICSAAHRDLRREVNSGRLREDLYYRLGRPEVRLPPLRERGEEIPWLVALALRRVAPELSADAALIEQCLLRPWPGNIRELFTEIAMAAHSALGRDSVRVAAEDLGVTAGRPLQAEPSGPAPLEPAPAEAAPIELTRQGVESQLRQLRGNVTSVARSLGVHRNSLRRWLTRHDIDPRLFRRRVPLSPIA